MSSRRAIKLIVAGIALVALALVAWVGVVAATGAGCSSCHDDAAFVEATEATGHEGIGCVTCHPGASPTARVSFAASVVFDMTLRLRPVDPSVGFVPDGSCAGCHDQDIAKVTNVRGLRIRHSTCALGSDCTSCHATAAHGNQVSWPRTPQMASCLECHDLMGAPQDCDACHVGRLPSDRITTGSFAVTHGPNAMETHGMGAMGTCSACHAAEKCTGCHGSGVPHSGDFAARHGAAASDPAADCESCHRAAYCSDCHQYELPHPETFLPDHPRIVEADGEAVCLRCHVKNDCESCHVAHVHPTTLDQQERLGITGRGEGSR